MLITFFASSIAVFAKLIQPSGAFTGIITSSFYFGSVIFRLINGTLAQKYGSKLLMLVGAALCMIVCFSYRLSTSIVIIVLIKILHGIGYSIFSAVSGTAAANTVPQSRLTEGMGYFTIGNVLAMAFGPAIAVAIIGKGTLTRFDNLFTIASIICLVSFILVLLIKNKSKDHNKSIHNHLNLTNSKNTALPKTFLGFEKNVYRTALLTLFMSLSYSPVIVYVISLGLNKGWHNIGISFIMYAIGLLDSRLFAGRISDSSKKVVHL